MKKPTAVFTFFNTISGQYSFWDSFATMIHDGLRLRGIENICFRRDYDEHSTVSAEKRFVAPEGSLGNPKWLREHVRPLAARFEKVIFHTHGHYQPIWLGREVWHHGRARWFWTEHLIADPHWSDPIKKVIRVAGQKARLLPYRLYGVSEPGADRLREQFCSSSVRCVRTGVSLLPKRSARKLSGVPRKGLFVGRLIPEKGIWPLLEAFVRLKERRVDVTLTVVGPGPLPEFEAYIQSHGLSDCVTLAGYQRDPGPFYDEADFVVVPSLWIEALGMVSLEARMRGVPVIYSRRGGLEGTQIDGVTGLALGEVSPEEIERKIIMLVSDPGRFATMSLAAPQGLEEFSIQAMIDSYLEDYQQAFGSM
jgi:glycosyltransferase involved in cell wall biosynthesis